MNRLDFNLGIAACCKQLELEAGRIRDPLPSRLSNNVAATRAGRLGWAAEAASIRREQEKAELLTLQAALMRKNLTK